MEKELLDYKKLIFHSLSKKEGMTIPNAGFDYSVLLYTELFKLSKSVIMVIDESYANITNNINFLNSVRQLLINGELNILVIGNMNLHSELINLLPYDSYLPIQINGNLFETSNENTFSIFDNNHTKFDINNEKYHSVCSLNKEEINKKLRNTYIKLIING